MLQAARATVKSSATLEGPDSEPKPGALTKIFLLSACVFGSLK